MYETAQKPERVILVGVNEGGDEKEVRESLDELGELVKTAGAEPFFKAYYNSYLRFVKQICNRQIQHCRKDVLVV